MQATSTLTTEQMADALAAWCEAMEATCSAATPGPWELLNCERRAVPPGYPEIVDEAVFVCKMPLTWRQDAAFIVAARTALPATVQYCRGLLTRHSKVEADYDRCAARYGEGASTTEGFRIARARLRTELQQFHARLEAAGALRTQQQPATEEVQASSDAATEGR